MTDLILLIAFAAFLLISLKSVKVIPQHYKGVVYRLGRLDQKIREPGLVFLVPFIEEMKLVSTRLEMMGIPAQNVITQDNKSLKAEADVHFKITDPIKTTNVADPYSALRQISQTAVRNEIGKVSSSSLASEQESLTRQIQDSLNDSVRGWGIHVEVVELKNLVYS